MKQKRIKNNNNKPFVVKHLSNGTIAEIWGKDKWKNLFAPVDISTLVFFRILFGLIMFYEVVRYFEKDWISSYWINPNYHFTYWPFDFLSPLPGDGMYYLFFVLGLLAIFIALGLFYRISTILFFFSFSYMFLLEQTRYMNHFYLVMLISFVLIFIPAHTSSSFDCHIFKKIRSETAPAWSLWFVRFMIFLPYFFGGVAKLNTDWLQGEPLNVWLSQDLDFPIIGPLFQYKWMILFMAYSGLFLDLLIVPALMFNKTRKWGFLLITLFHLMNSQLFQIGIFPWFMIVSTTLFFDPGWPRKVINFISGNSWPLVKENESFDAEKPLVSSQKWIIAGLIFWVLLHVLLPIRHFFIPGSVHWTEEGHRYAWHMKLRTKRAISTYTVLDKKTGKREVVDLDNFVDNRQRRKMGGKPYLIWKLGQFIKEDYKSKGIDVAVYANVKASLNGRKYQQLIDSTVDITSVPRPIFPASWIVPLTTPLRDKLTNDYNGEDIGE